jgi:hypothetical protein
MPRTTIITPAPLRRVGDPAAGWQANYWTPLAKLFAQ